MKQVKAMYWRLIQFQGMTATSLVPKAAAAVGDIRFPDLCEKILLSASLNDK